MNDRERKQRSAVPCDPKAANAAPRSQKTDNSSPDLDIGPQLFILRDPVHYNVVDTVT